MSKDLTVTHPQEGVQECLRVMTDKHIRHLPVLDGDTPVGIISIRDLMRLVIDDEAPKGG